VTPEEHRPKIFAFNFMLLNLGFGVGWIDFISDYSIRFAEIISVDVLDGRSNFLYLSCNHIDDAW